MRNTEHRAVAIVGLGAVLPDAPDVGTFWSNIEQGRYSVSDVDPERWDPALFYDPDPRAPDKTYSRIGGWVRDFEWDPFRWKLPIPPTVTERMDIAQRWAIGCTRSALADYGYPSRKLDEDRTAVILGNAMGGELHYLTSFKIFFPEFGRHLDRAPSFSALPRAVREAIQAETHGGMATMAPDITEDTMPGELSNCIAGRIANLYNFHGPNYVTDAACASAMAAMSAAIEGLIEGHFDAVVSGGIDRNMGPSSFVKFCKIGALSATGTRPYAAGADGFVMSEGAAIFLLRRLADAERDGDRIYAVIRGFGGSSDGKGKGITAPNPIGQRIAVRRGWENAGLSPTTATLIEGHGTSTRVGDVVEVESLTAVFNEAGVTPSSVRLGSVKSNLGHLKGAAGAAGLLKATLALHHKRIPPSLNFDRPNPNIDFANSPFSVNTELEAWEKPACGVRRAGVSAFGFGGTNFHAVLEEHIPGMLSDRRVFRGADVAPAPLRPPPSGLVVLGAATPDDLRARVQDLRARAAGGELPLREAPLESDIRAPERLALDYEGADELVQKLDKALAAFETGDARRWQLLASQGIFRGRGGPARVAFLYTGQGSQYPNMLADLRAAEPIVARVFDEADRVMTPLLGKPLSEYIFVDPADTDAVAAATESLRQTTITQPAVLSVDTALTQLLASWGMEPDMVMGHSLGEYGALVAAGALDFGHALEAVSARGREMERVSVGDNGAMAAVSAPIERVQEVLDSVDGYVVIANINSRSQAVIGGATEAVTKAVAALKENGMRSVPLSVSHAFHTRIVAPASSPLSDVLKRLGVRIPVLPVVSNVTGEFYPTGENTLDAVIELLGRQVAEPVQFVKGLDTLYDAGVRVFVETGPKRALTGFVQDVFGDRPDALALYTNHPRLGDVASVNRCLCGLYAAGRGIGRTESLTPEVKVEAPATPHTPPAIAAADASPPDPITTHPKMPSPSPSIPSSPSPSPSPSPDSVLEAARILSDFLSKGLGLPGHTLSAPAQQPEKRIVISGAGLGLPGTARVFDDANLVRIMNGEVLIDAVPAAQQQGMVDRRVTRLVKRADGDPTFESIGDTTDVIKLAGRGGAFDLVAEFGVSADRDAALNASTRLAMAAGIDALRDAGIPLVHNYRTTTRGTYLPQRWQLPDSLRDDTGVIFACAFPGADVILEDASRYYTDKAHRRELAGLESIRALVVAGDSSPAVAGLDDRIATLRQTVEREEFTFNRRYLFRILAMGHSQFAEEIGARGPNTQVNAACASTTLAVSLAEDWIRAGRCRRVIIVAGDDVTRDETIKWFGAGFLASGVAATDESVEDAALPFDRRRHGMLMGMGAAALVVEEAGATAERGIRPICEVMATVSANSAFHGTRLDIEHIGGVMETLVSTAERRWGITRAQLAPETVFVSHETYTPARGGSASAEVYALRKVFGDHADDIVIANTKGFTGHPMAVGIEDVIAVRILETGIVPPVPNLREIDPELGNLNLSRGGAYPVRFALRLGAGFGSQISMSLLGWIPAPDGQRPPLDGLGFGTRVADAGVFQSWLAAVSGYPVAELETDHRRLRIKDQGPPAVQPLQATTPFTQPAISVPPAISAQPAPVAPPSPSPSPSPIEDAVLRIVSEQTGYPPDMLDMDLDLEADLGVDTVKQAETFAAVRAAYGIERDESLKLRDYPTLNHVVQFVKERLPAEVLAAMAPAVAAGSAAGGASVVPSVATAAQPVATSTRTGDDEIRERVLAIVAEQTGYPPDMLDMDLDLEADLGVDTVKQAETFAAVRAAYGIERDESLKLRDYPTLNHVVQFVKERLPAASAPAAGAGDPSPTDAPAHLSVTAAPRRVPRPVLRPPLAMCKPTGVRLAEGDRVVVMPDSGGVGKSLIERLEKRGIAVLELDPGMGAEAIGTRLGEWLAAGAIHGVFWLPALDGDPPIGDLDLATWRTALDLRVKRLYTTMRWLYEAVSRSGTFLVAGTRLGGLHGYDTDGAVNPSGGAVSGFVKAFARERPDALCKVIDFESSRKTAALADTLIDETLRDPGAVEIGVRDATRWTVGLVEDTAGDGSGGLVLGPDSTFVVTGAAGSIVSAIVKDLAMAANGGTFHLLDLAAEPDASNPDLERFRTDPAGLRREIFERLKAAGDRATPAMVEKEMASLERAEAALAAMRAVQASGGVAHYHSLDLRDGKAVARVIESVRSDSGRIDVLMHAAGLEISRFLPDKEPAEFDRVFDVKADGWFNLLRAAEGIPIGAAVVFSSIAGRFGNGGQTDYSAANDLLCKCVSGLRTSRPDTRGLAIDWTAWSGIGMASRGSIPKMMEAAGIDMLAPEIGIPVVRQEITSASNDTEIVVAGNLGLMLEPRDATGGLDTEAATAPRGPMIGRVLGMGADGRLAVETELDPAKQPFLFDHQIDGTAVLPGVMGIEAFAELSLVPLPGYAVDSIEDVQFLAPFKFYRDEPRTVRLEALFRGEGDAVVAHCRLLGIRNLPGQPEPQVTTHFTARVRLVNGAETAQESVQETAQLPDAGERVARAADIYRIYFHGPAYQVIDNAWINGSESVAGRMTDGLPPNHEPGEQPLLMAPRHVEACFQTAGLHELATAGTLGLPLAVQRIRTLAQPPADGCHAIVRPRGDGGYDADIVDGLGNICLRLERYQTVALPGGPDAGALGALRTGLNGGVA